MREARSWDGGLGLRDTRFLRQVRPSKSLHTINYILNIGFSFLKDRLYAMRSKLYFLSLLLLLDWTFFACASVYSSVHRGLELEEALSKARTVCPTSLGSRKLSRVKAQIKNLLRPTTIASDPHRKEYARSYVSTPERIDAQLMKICGPESLELKPGNFELQNDQVDEEENTLLQDNDLRDSESIDGNLVLTRFDWKDVTLCMFGLVLVLQLLALLHFMQKGQITVQTGKSLRRPEL